MNREVIATCSQFLNQLRTNPDTFTSAELLDMIDTFAGNNEELKHLAYRAAVMALIQAIMRTASV